ncbi:MAG: class C sortase [Tissierellia bacterium]|nr:class C sortase [Tissierellia bacterium]
MPTKWKGNLTILLGVILILASGFFFIASKVRANEQRAAAEAFERELAEGIVMDHGEVEIGDPVPQSSLGVIRLDKIGVVLPIFFDTSSESLEKGAGLVEGTDPPAPQRGITSVIAAHRGGRRESQSFMKVDQLTPGDAIQVTTQESKLTYEVVGQVVVEAKDWSHFYREEHETRLLLLTCHPYPRNHQRLLVEAKLVSSEQI